MRLPATVAGVAVLVAAAALLAGPAVADPRYPTDEEVRRSRVDVQEAAGEVGRLQSRLAVAIAEQEDAEVDLSVAAEEYDTAAVELARARDVARLAEVAAGRASRQLSAAQRDVGRLAAQAYRQGGGVSSLAVMLSPRGPRDVVDRASMLRTVAGHRQHSVRRMDAARVVTAVLQQQAAQAVAEQERAARHLAATRAAAERRAAAARTVARRSAETSEAVLARLAQVRRTSIDVERRRQQGLTAERAASPESPERAQGPGAAANRATVERPVRQPEPRATADRPVQRPERRTTAEPRSRPRETDPRPPRRSTPGGSPSAASSGGGAAVAWARRQVGLPYQWGGEGPGSYDCSGLTMRAWERAGVRLPHSSRWQYRSVEKVTYGDLRPGDLVFYGRDPLDPGSIHHVSMYAGGGLMVEAPAAGLKVRVVPLRRKHSMPYAGRP